MPIPTFTGLRPKPQFEDVVHKLNELADELTNLMLNLDTLNVVELDAKVIRTGVLLAALVTIQSDLAGGAFIRIDGNGMVINDGTKDVFLVDVNGHVTMTGATVQTTSGTYPRIELASVGNLLTAYLDAVNYLAISPTAIGGTPTLYYHDNGSMKGSLSMVSGDLSLLSIGAADINIGASQDLFLYAGNYVNFRRWDLVRNEFTGHTLQQDLNAKADAVSYSTTFDVIDSVDFVTQTTTSKTITVTNGMITNVS